jgi:capsid protein
MLRARYDAAATTDDNRRHWANADGLSANAANSPEVRRILRNRARYKVANNSYARGIVLTLANDVIGTGPRLQLLTDDAEANRRIEQEFARWAKAVGLAEKLRTMRMARAQDGEAFAILTNNRKLPTSVQLDLRLVEADQVCTPDLSVVTQNAIDGIVFDAVGNPVEYHVLREHPGETSRRFILEYDRVPAESVLHWFRADRPGQARGIPDIMPALPLFAQLRRFTLAVIAAAETAADFAGILYTDAPADASQGTAEEVRARAVAETNRIAAIRRVCNGRFPEIEAQAIQGGWDVTRCELEVLRACRPRTPAVHVPDNTVTGTVLEAACLMTAGLNDLDRLYEPQALDLAAKRFRGGIGLQELLLEAAWANGYSGCNFSSSPCRSTLATT